MRSKLKGAGKQSVNRVAGTRVGVGVLFALAALVVLAPLASAAPLLTLKTPFSGTPIAAVSAGFGGCGASASWARAPFFNLTTGHGVLSAMGKAVACGSTLSDASVYAYTGYYSSTFTLGSGGHHKLTETWVLSYSIDLVATPGGPTHPASSTSDVYLDSYIYDTTNHTYISPVHAANLYNSISTGSLVKTFTGVHFVGYLNGTFAAGHVYYVVAEIVVEAYVTAGPGSGSASALVNMGTAGKHAVLSSIVIT
jgi:hypothetical protein